MAADSIPRFPNLGAAISRLGHVYAQHWLLILLAYAVPTLFLAALSILLAPISGGDTLTPLLLNLVLTAIGSVIDLVIVALVAQITANTILNRPVSVGELASNLVPHLGTLTVLAVPVLVATFLGNLAGLAPFGGENSATNVQYALLCVSLVVRPLLNALLFFPAILTAQPAVLENLSLSEAIQKTLNLTTNVRGQLLLLAFVINLVLGRIAAFVPTLVASTLANMSLPISTYVLLSSLAALVVGMIVLPPWFCLVTLLYLDLRAQREPLALP